MADPTSIDGLLVQWGDRLFYAGNRRVGPAGPPRLRGADIANRAATIRSRIRATVLRRAPQVMVKVTGGGRGMKAIAAHLRYIAKNGRLDVEDEDGRVQRGKTAVREIAEDWRFGGPYIDDESPRREAFNVMLSMLRGTDAAAVQGAAREFARAEFADHKYVLVLHDHQAHPHVHLSVRAESRSGRRLNPRKADLQRWREVFAERLGSWGVEAEATRQATRGVARNYPPIWRLHAQAEDRLMVERPPSRRGSAAAATRSSARLAWSELGKVLQSSKRTDDLALAEGIERYLGRPSVHRARAEAVAAKLDGRDLSRGQAQ